MSRKRTVDDLVATYVGAAARNPARRDRVYREAASTLGRLSLDPRNAPFRAALEAAAFEFAGAAAGWRPAPPSVTDDLHERAVETALAREALEGSQEDLAVEAGRRMVEEAGSPGERVAISPRSLQNAALGRSGKFKSSPTEAEKAVGVVPRDTLAFWQGDKPEAQAVTVDVAPLALPAPPLPWDQPFPRPSMSIRAFAAVEFGSDGNKLLVEVDVPTRLTVAGNYVSVLGGVRAQGVAAEYETPTILGASIGMFAAPSQAPVTFTAYVDLLDAGDSILVQRPTKGAQLLPLQTTASGGSTQIDFLDVIAAGVIARLAYPSGSVAATPIPLAPDVGWLRLTNNTGELANYRVIFQLSL